MTTHGTMSDKLLSSLVFLKCNIVSWTYAVDLREVREEPGDDSASTSLWSQGSGWA